MKSAIALILALAVAASSCSKRDEGTPSPNEDGIPAVSQDEPATSKKEEGTPPPKKDTVPTASQDKPATLENCLALAELLEFSVNEAGDGVRTAEIGSRLSTGAREEGIRIARERLTIVGEMLDLFERDAANYREDPRIKPHLLALPGYRERLADLSTQLDRLSR